MEKVTCVCITYNRVELLKESIKIFHDQEYDHKDLLVLYQSNDKETDDFVKFNSDYSLSEVVFKERQGNTNYSIVKLRAGKSDVSFLKVPFLQNLSLGTKRNIAISQASGDYICIWDDDDWYSKYRISYQVEFMKFSNKSACTLASILLHDKSSGNLYVTGIRAEGWEGTLLCRKNKMPLYHDLNKQEDTPVIHALLGQGELCIMEDPGLYVYNVHLANTSGNAHFERILQLSMPEKLNEYIDYKYYLSETVLP